MPLIALFVIAFISLFIVRVGAKALMMTGLSRSVAGFQAISCFFGVGFTTAEAEMIVSHPVRRRIAAHLIIAGNIGLTSALGAVLMSFMQDENDWVDDLVHPESPAAFFARLAVIIIGVVGIIFVMRVRVVERTLEWFIEGSLNRVGVVRAMDYETVLNSDDGYVVVQLEIVERHPLVGVSLRRSQLGSRGVLVLGILRRDGVHLGAPSPETTIEALDVLTVYGREGHVHAALDLPKGPASPPSASEQPDDSEPVE